MLAYNLGLFSPPRMRSACTIAPIPRTRTTLTARNPQAPPCRERIAPRRMTTQPPRLSFIAVSGFPAGEEDESVFDSTGFGSASAFVSALTGAGDSSTISASFTAFALSSNPPIVHPRYLLVTVMGL